MTKRSLHPPHSLHSDSAHLETLVAALRRSRLRVTEPRIAILKVLANRHGPFTIEEIHHAWSQKVCDLATIYRSMASLEKAGLVHRCEFGDGTARYELASPKDHHHHVICKVCKRIEVLDDCELQEIDRFAKRRGFTEVTHSLEFFGICRECS